MKIKDLESYNENIVDIVGRIINIRKHKDLQFIVLQDHSGEIQCISNGRNHEIPQKYSVVKISGTLINNDIVRTGLLGKEIKISSIEPLSVCYEQPRFEPSIRPNSRRLGIENRHILLRNPNNRLAYEKKSVLLKSIRDFLSDNEFMEVQSPSIVRDGVEGSVNAFQVNYFEENAFLSLSNILYHHILISGGFEKIYEMGKLFRQEKSYSSIHLNEFMILDYTQANIDRDGIMDLTERLIKNLIVNMENKGVNCAVELPNIFPVVKYTELLSYLNNKGHNLGWGEMHTIGRSVSDTIKEKYPSFFWIIDQPEESKSFFTDSREDENGRMVCRDFQLWYADNADLADGAERVIDYKKAVKRMENLGINTNNFYHYLDSLKHGLYPNTGVGLGLDRLVMTLTGIDNIRDIVLFPRDPKTITP